MQYLLAILLTFLPLAVTLWIFRNTSFVDLLMVIIMSVIVAVGMMIITSSKTSNKVLIGYYSFLAIVVHYLIYPLTSYPTHIVMSVAGVSHPSPPSWTFWVIQGSFIVSSILLCHVVSR